MRTEQTEIKIHVNIVAVLGCSHSLQHICQHQHAKKQTNKQTNKQTKNINALPQISKQNTLTSPVSKKIQMPSHPFQPAAPTKTLSNAPSVKFNGGHKNARNKAGADVDQVMSLGIPTH